MWLIAALGNPGAKYTLTRHNVGFLLADRFVQGFPGTSEKTQLKGLVSKVQYEGESLLIVKPQTFMNLSGESVIPLMNFYKIPKEKLIVAHDEIDLPFGTMKLQKSRGHGGHNGIRDIHAKLGNNDYIRLRLGVGRPTNPKIDVAAHVLQNFDDSEMAEMGDFLDFAGDAICAIVTDGFDKAATKFNSNK